MLKFIVLFFAAFAVFSPLFLIGIRKYTGRIKGYIKKKWLFLKARLVFL